MKKFLSFAMAAAAISFTLVSTTSCKKSDDPAPATDTASVFTGKVLLAPLADNTSKTFISFSSGTTYNVTDAKANSGAIDAGYFFGPTALATFASPSDYLTTAYDLSGWSTKNQTLFRKNITGSFANFITKDQIKTAYDSGSDTQQNGSGGTSTASTRIQNLTDGTVFAFKTAAGKYGVVSVRTVTAGGSGQIQFDYKIQK